MHFRAPGIPPSYATNASTTLQRTPSSAGARARRRPLPSCSRGTSCSPSPTAASPGSRPRAPPPRRRSREGRWRYCRSIDRYYPILRTIIKDNYLESALSERGALQISNSTDILAKTLASPFRHSATDADGRTDGRRVSKMPSTSAESNRWRQLSVPAA